MNPSADYHLSMSLEDEVAQLVVTGTLKVASLDALRAEGLAFLRGSNARGVLWEIRASKTYPGLAEAYFRARSVPTDFLRVPTAIVDQTKNHEFESFYETTSYNAGLTVKFFPEAAAAKVWLKSRIAGPRDDEPPSQLPEHAPSPSTPPAGQPPLAR